MTAVFSGGYDDHVFLVPDRVLAKNGTDSGYHVFLRDGDRARAVPVAEARKNGGKIRIYSTELKAGAELLMPSAGEKIGNGDRIAVDIELDAFSLPRQRSIMERFSRWT